MTKFDGLAIIVACLASFRNLFSRQNLQHGPKQFEPPNRSNLFLRDKPRGRLKNLTDEFASTSDKSYSRIEVYIDVEIDTQPMMFSFDFALHGHSQLPKPMYINIRKNGRPVNEPV